jgi:RimJ/RimL family protein N-acetyltransferase
VQIREAEPDDAGVVISLFERLYSETPFLLYEPNAQVPKVNVYARRIENARRAQRGVVYLAQIEREAVGVVFGNRGAARSDGQSLFLVLGVAQAYWNRGVGLSLLRAVEHWASSHGLHRLKLTVQKRNTRAVALYIKAGFETDGTKHRSLVVSGEHLDEWRMSKVIAAQPSVAEGAQQQGSPTASCP